MNIAPTASVSGMAAASLRLDNTANNVANVNTQNFAPRRIEQTETAAARAPRQAQARDTYEPTTEARGTGTEAYAAGTQERDLARDMTDLATQRNTYDANLRTARAVNETVGAVIDLAG